jgi:hypothetical protein
VVHSVPQLELTLYYSVVPRTLARQLSISASVHTRTRSHTFRARVASSSVLVVADDRVVSRSKRDYESCRLDVYHGSRLTSLDVVVFAIVVVDQEKVMHG